MTRTTTYTCLECDHTHEIPVILGEYPDDDYAELPEACEVCGAPNDGDCTVDDRQSERRQMGITD